MMNLQKMTYKALEKKLLDNQMQLSTADLKTKRILIREDYEIMVEMDRRLAAAEKKLLAGRK